MARLQSSLLLRRDRGNASKANQDAAAPYPEFQQLLLSTSTTIEKKQQKKITYKKKKKKGSRFKSFGYPSGRLLEQTTDDSPA